MSREMANISLVTNIETVTEPQWKTGVIRHRTNYQHEMGSHNRMLANTTKTHDRFFFFQYSIEVTIPLRAELQPHRALQTGYIYSNQMRPTSRSTTVHNEH